MKNNFTRSLLLTIFILCLNLAFVSMTKAQTKCSDESLVEARKNYEIGRFREVVSALGSCIKDGFNEKQKVQGYRLLAMSYLATDSLEKATEATNFLIQINPDYEGTVFDPPRFTRLVTELKLAGGAQLVTSVSKKAENVFEAPATIIVVTREEIEKRGYLDLVEMLKDVPGFDLSMFYGSEYANIYQRGFRQNNTEKTLLLIDGIEENDLWTNWAYLSRQYPLSNIERVEIIYGPASTMYGPNAFVGVINVITRSAQALIAPGRNIGVHASVNYGTYNTRCFDMTVAGKKRNMSFALTGRIFTSDEADLTSQKYFDFNPSFYETVDYNKLLGITTNAKQYLVDHNMPMSHPYYQLSADSSKLSLTPQGILTAQNLDKSAYEQVVNGHKIGFSNKTDAWLLNGKIKLGNFSFGFQTWRESRGSLTQYTDTYTPGSDNGFNWVPQLSYFFTKYENQLSDKFFVSSLTYYRIHALTEDSRFVSLSNYALGNFKLNNLVAEKAPIWTTQYAYEISKQLRTELKTVYTPFSNFDLVSGLEARNSTLQGGYMMSVYDTPQDSAVVNPSPKGGNTFNVWDIGVYSQGTYSILNNLKATLGLRYDYNRIRSNGGFGGVVSPRIAVVYSPGNFTFKGFYARGIMNVSNWTKFSTAGNRIPNPMLKTENIQNYEFSGAFKFSKSAFIEMSVYQEDIDNVVGTQVVAGNPSKNQNANIGQFQIRGAQMNAVYIWQDYHFNFNYTWCDPRQTYSETGSVDNVVGDIAVHQFNIGADKEFFKQLNINLRMNYSGNRRVGTGTTVPLNKDHFPAVAVAYATISYENIRVVKGMKLQLICNNIFDTVYFHPGTKAADGINSPTAILQRGRHFVLRLMYDF
ncbi:MAG: TonB-dependent receptor [Bacteroidota bacterium]